MFGAVPVLKPCSSNVCILFVDGQIEVLDLLGQPNTGQNPRISGSDANDLNGPYIINGPLREVANFLNHDVAMIATGITGVGQIECFKQSLQVEGSYVLKNRGGESFPTCNNGRVLCIRPC